MRQDLLRSGAKVLSYEIRGIVKKAEQLEQLGYKIYWENIGDPIQKNHLVPQWIKKIVIDLLKEDTTYGYTHSKGNLLTRQFLANRTNALGKVQITINDILFFNGLGDAISKLYQFIVPTSRIIGPSPAYSTHSSAEAAHANASPLTYKLDPDNFWYPDLHDLYSKIKYNPNIVGILIINPDNPTGMIYPLEILREIVKIAKTFNLFLISDEIYINITYNGQKTYALAEIIEDLPGIALKGISKELPWPGARCGWMEYYNRSKDSNFNDLCNTLDNAKMIEVCSTHLPQLAIPKILGHPYYQAYRKDLNTKIGHSSDVIADFLKDIPQIKFNKTQGAFYNTIIFKDNTLNDKQILKIRNQETQDLLNSWIEKEKPNLDGRFVYYLLAAKGICVVPISSFCSDLLGFRITLLEADKKLLIYIFSTLREALIEYFES